MNFPVLPRHGHDTLSDLLPSIGAHLGVPEHQWDSIGLPSARRYVVLLVDGLGRQVLARHLDIAPWFAEHFGDAHRLTAGIPSTTATSLTCLGTGCAPGQHGMAGYSFRSPVSGGVMNPLTWDGAPADPEAFQPLPTVFEQAVAAGVEVESVGPARFEDSGLTRAALRGATFRGVEDEEDRARRIQLTLAACSRGERSLVYVYERALDHTAHGCGVDSDEWRGTLRKIDRFCQVLAEVLPSDVCLLITGDHGMVDVPRSRHIMFEDTPGLRSGVEIFAGEGRMRQLWTPRPDKVAAVWQRELGDRALVVTKDEALAQGWFGPVDDRVLGHFGDVLVAMRDDWAVMSRTLPRELGLVGQHGSLTEDEMAVPLVVAMGGGAV